MRTMIITALGFLLVTLLGTFAWAGAPWTFQSITLTLVTTADEEVVLNTGLPTVPLESGDILDRAQLSLQVTFSPGTEVELWHAASADSTPWLAENGGREALLDLWIVDQPTGSLVLLNVADYVRAVVADPENAGVILLRAVGPDGEPVAFTAQNATTPELKVWVRESAQ